MKTSNMLIIAALIISLGMITTYNFSLKAAYEAGNYKNRFNESEFTEIKNIKTLNVADANLISIVVEAGQKEGIWIRKRVKDRLVLKQNGEVFTIGLTDKAKEDNRRTGYDDIVLFTNSLNKLKTTAFWPVGEKKTRENVYGGEVSLKGLRTDNFDINVSSSTTVSVNKMVLKTLKAVVGGEKGTALLNLDSANQIEYADFEILGASHLSLSNPKIVKTRYDLSDKATVTLNGAALQEIKNQ